MTAEQIAVHQRAIDAMSRMEMCQLWRRAPAGHPYFDRRLPELSEYFEAKFKALGGFSPAISKAIGWDK